MFFKSIFVYFCLCFLIVSWEDHPDVQDFKETDKIYRAACIQVGYDEFELLSKNQEKEYDEKYRTSHSDTVNCVN